MREAGDRSDGRCQRLPMQILSDANSIRSNRCPVPTVSGVKGAEADMKTVIYGDIYFLINFSMDFLSLFLVAKLLHIKEKTGRTVAGAVLGALGATLSLFLPGQFFSVFLTATLPFVMTLVTFGWGNLLSFLKKGAVLFGVSFAMGGIMTAVYYVAGRWLGAREIVIGGRVDILYGELPGWLVVLTAVMAAFLAFLFSRFTGRRLREKTVEVVVEDGGRRVSFTALWDSGNLLREPFGGLPVIVVGLPVFSALLETADLERLTWDCREEKEAALTGVQAREGAPEGTGAGHASNAPRGHRPNDRKFRFIPAATVAGEGLLHGYLPDTVQIGREKKRACLALDTTGRDFDGCDGIVPTALLN